MSGNETLGRRVTPGNSWSRHPIWSGIIMSAKWLLACGVFSLVLVSVRADEQGKLDPEKLIGTWTYVSGEKDGEKVSEDNLKAGSVVITKDKITLKSPQGEFVIKYALDTKKHPCAIAMEITEGPGGQGSKADGIIAVKDDDLKICYPPMGGKAPTEFAAKKDSGLHYFVLKRKK
jgi:uncharacterized protein (TIGR03067 family)